MPANDTCGWPLCRATVARIVSHHDSRTGRTKPSAADRLQLLRTLYSHVEPPADGSTCE